MYLYTLRYLIVTPNLHIFHLNVININIFAWWLFLFDFTWINTNVLILPISVQSIVLLEHRIYWYTYKDRYIQFMTWIMTVLHFNLPLMIEIPISLDFKWKTQGTERFTLSELLRGFLQFLGHHKLSGDWTFHSWDHYILWKINRSNTVQTAEGPFGFLFHVTDQCVVTSLVCIPPLQKTNKQINKQKKKPLPLSSHANCG